MKKTLVVARYERDVGWSNIPGWETFVVQKGKHLPNVGREPLSYIWYIIKHYDELEGIYAFSQDRISDQVPHLPGVLQQTEELPKGVQFIYTATPRDHGDGRPLHPGLDIRGMHKELFPEDEQPDVYTFYSGCFFMATAEKIREHPIEFYYKLFTLVVTYYDGAWALERLLHYVFREDEE